MKLKSLLLGLTAAALTSAAAHAQTVIYVTGSTAYRAPAVAAILNYLNSNTSGNVVNGAFAVSSPVSPSTASDLFGSSNGIYENSSGSIVVETNFTGSAAGLVDIVIGNTQKFLATTGFSLSPINITGIVGPGGTQTYGTEVAKSFITNSQVPNLSFSDTFYTTVAASINNANIENTITDPNGNIVTAKQLNQQILAGRLKNAGSASAAGAQDAVGIVPFAWFLGNSSSSTKSGITNVTQQAAASLITGATPVQLFTGSTAVSGNVYLIGRNEDSGTRVEAFAEAQKGFVANPKQYELTFSSGGTNNSGNITFSNGSDNGSGSPRTTSEVFGTSTLQTGGVDKTTPTAIDAVVSGAVQFEDDAALYTQPNIAWDLTGHSGYAGGGDVANVLLSDNANPGSVSGLTGNAFFMGYLGFADGYGLLSPKNYASNAVECSYNGVAASVANIQNGSYTLWGFEHMYYIQSGSTPNVVTSGSTTQTVINGIADLIFGTYADTTSAGTQNPDGLTGTPNIPPAGILYSTSLVTRTQEGQPVKLK